MYESTSHQLKSQLFINTIIQNLLFNSSICQHEHRIINTVHVTFYMPSLVSDLKIDLYRYRYKDRDSQYLSSAGSQLLVLCKKKLRTVAWIRRCIRRMKFAEAGNRINRRTILLLFT